MNRYLVGLHHGDLTRSLEESELAQTLARTAPPPVDVPLPLSDTIDVPPPASELAELAAEPFERAIRFRMLVEPREARGQSSELEAELEAELIAEEGERGEFGNES
jgi:hypothetical protein